MNALGQHLARFAIQAAPRLLIWGWVTGALILAGGWSSPVLATVLLGAKVVTDGSVNPPGERLDIDLAFLPAEEELTLEVRGFVFFEKSPNEVSPLPARDPSRRASQAPFQVSRRVAPPRKGRLVRESIVIAFAALRLPRGIHRLGFEISGRRGETIDFVQATTLFAVQVTSGRRREMTPPDPPPTLKHSHSEQPVLIAEDGKVRSVTARLEVTEPEFSLEATRPVRVDIPGEFLHPLFSIGSPDTEEMDEDVAAAMPVPGAGWAAADQFVPEPRRTVHFATNRRVVNPAEFGLDRYGTVAGELSFGKAVVNIPLAVHRRGALELPGYWSRPDPAKHFLVERLETWDRQRFLAEVAPGDVLLYVHGYKTTFEYALLRAAQVVHDLEFPGRGLVFSWPSAGKLTGYSADEEQAAQSSAALAELLQALTGADSPAAAGRRIHVIAHSMGNRVFLAAARQWELEHPELSANKPLGQVLLAAPDVNATMFAALLPSVIRLADSTTMYYCEHDVALTASRALHLDKPVGLGPFFAEGLQTINANEVDTSALAHGYFSETRELLFDIRLAVRYGLKPDQRHPPLSAAQKVYGYPLWAFLPRL